MLAAIGTKEVGNQFYSQNFSDGNEGMPYRL
jgi:hypothetical protein